MEIAVVAEREEIQLQALALHHAPFGDVHDADFRKVRLACNGAQRGELGAEELHPVVMARVLVLESLQHLGGVISTVGYLVPQLL